MENMEKPLLPTIGFSTFRKLVERLRDNPKFRKIESMELEVLREEFGITDSLANPFRDSFKALGLVSPLGNLIKKPAFYRFLDDDDLDHQKNVLRKLPTRARFSTGKVSIRKQRAFLRRSQEFTDCDV